MLHVDSAGQLVPKRNVRYSLGNPSARRQRARGLHFRRAQVRRRCPRRRLVEMAPRSRRSARRNEGKHGRSTKSLDCFAATFTSDASSTSFPHHRTSFHSAQQLRSLLSRRLHSSEFDFPHRRSQSRRQWTPSFPPPLRRSHRTRQRSRRSLHSSAVDSEQDLYSFDVRRSQVRAILLGVSSLLRSFFREGAQQLNCFNFL